ncbi:hypothetical protein HN51_064043 [Arachis hypogaea]|nr:uncharacterized protein LOC107640364 [Arachis ipaensis]XP_020961440.1 uncharacterized protein LOC107640364 [Arachis ipaensis]XP_020961442.1 uncharacterized protein LOC107640364 [Arachis ipaensis]XP_020961444.1 uncharacterized protein LOC107640364 [Arachis ipaensis]XP_020961447.1 uncharacterized protein LOC107640364 [Arachis ipaensis]XP_025630415.1 uncharacterized protein LOC112723308 [Arachis hypogaea]XP_029146174.1 uncharacterized protein LOC112723308 [Arachis hypogaea]
MIQSHSAILGRTRMSNENEIGEIQLLVSSGDKSSKCSGYSSLLHFQEHSSLNPSSLHSLSLSSHSIVSSLISDISNHDEEIAAQALKCLGFMIYHPSIVSSLPPDDVNLVLESLSKLITTTKLKSACNLGVWCISVQQLGESFLATHFHSLLLAIVHALDNPMGSLSTTFEATQAVMKLCGQLSKQMRDSSHIWAPPIYRRLLSTDKRERDATERCLLKVKTSVIPPSLDLSKVLVKDMKLNLLSGMKKLLDKGMKIQVIQAWGWFIRMLGSHALKTRQLVNDSLKIPECTFTDLDPQVQIATLVAWEGLIDALVHCTMLDPNKNTPAKENHLQKQHSLERNNCDVQANGFSKSIRLIMTPLNGIMSSKCDISVHSSCLNTWCYLLHKLETSINEPSLIKMVLEPILKAIFQNGPDSKSIWLWGLGLDLLSDSISQKCRDVLCQSTNQFRDRISETGPSLSAKCSWKLHPIRWLPWDISQLDFYLSMISVLICQASRPTVTSDHRSLVYDAAAKLFTSVLKGVKHDLESTSTNYDGIMLCLKSILTFIKNVCEDLCTDGTEKHDLYCISIRFIEVVTKELDSLILGSPLYKFSLDLKYIGGTQSGDHNEHLNFSVSRVSYMDKVSPMVYLIAVYFHMLDWLAMNSSQLDCKPQRSSEYFKFIFSSSDSPDNLLTFVGFLYKDVRPIHLKIWITLAEGLNGCARDPNCRSLRVAMSDSAAYSSICHLLIYPIVVHTETARLTLSNAGASSENYKVLLEKNPMLDLVIQTWISLYESLSASGSGCSTTTNFSGDLCTLLSRCLDDSIDMAESGIELHLKCNDTDLGILHLSGNFMICILDHIQTSELVSETEISNTERESKILCGIKNCLKLAARYMNLLMKTVVIDPLPGFVGTSRVSSALANFVSRLHRKQDILLFLEIISCPLLQWLSNMVNQDETTNEQLQHLWTEILSCLKRSQPPMNFGSALLRLHETLFEKTLDHPYPSISKPTITFWNSTFGQQVILDFPPNLLSVLDRLSRNGKLKLQKRSLPPLQKCRSSKEVSGTLPGYWVTATHNRTSKRIELVLDAQKDASPLSVKKRRLELTEHQKEVRRAQQGRERDSGGHGPGIRTYTNADFSQGLDESQESQEIRDSEAILQMLRKTI